MVKRQRGEQRRNKERCVRVYPYVQYEHMHGYSQACSKLVQCLYLNSSISAEHLCNQ